MGWFDNDELKQVINNHQSALADLTLVVVVIAVLMLLYLVIKSILQFKKNTTKAAVRQVMLRKV